MSFEPSKTRIVGTCVIAVSALFGPWWLTLSLAVLMALRFRAWELVYIGALFDLTWMAVPVGFSISQLPLATITAILLIILFEPFRRRLLLGSQIL